MKTLLSIAAAATLASSSAQAQTAVFSPIEHDVVKVVSPGDGKENVMFERRVLMAGPDTVEFVSAESSIGKTVKGAPYSAEAVTESIQTFADGNRIMSKSSATTYRDSEGRTRREMTLSMPGIEDPPSFITINDPVANVSFHLETKARIARKMPVAPDGMAFATVPDTPGIRIMRAPAPGGAAVGVTHDVIGPVAGAASIQHKITVADSVRTRAGTEPKTESLGKRGINGVEAEGSRTTLTIPAGEIGNEREINIVTERWYSPELQTVVLTKHTDPRVGETTYTLTNIKRVDPHPSLFQVPSDYSLANEEPMPAVRMIRKIERK